jgi:hypothetical protein
MDKSPFSLMLVLFSVRFPIPIPQGPCLITAGGAHQAWSSTFTVLTLAGNFGHRHSTGAFFSHGDTPSSLDG